MDEQVTDVIHEHTAVPENMADHPLVTFLLVSYNQEQFIREAVEGAFSQTYEPLEIILSDDCSTDKTFEIMQEMAANYRGPHTVIARQNSENMGTLRHLLQAVDRSSGAFIVLAAGDDVSRPGRVTALQASWKESGSWAVFSDYAEVDEKGNITAEHLKTNALFGPGYRLRAYMAGEQCENSIVHGASSAYDRSVFEHVYLPDDGYILAEDGALSLLLHIMGKDVSYVPEPLVDYRRHGDSLTHANKRRMTWAQLTRAEEKMARFALSQANRCKFIIKSQECLKHKYPQRIENSLVYNDYKRLMHLSQWWSLNIIQRIRAIFEMEIASKKWALPRLISRRAFLAIKYINNHLKYD